jgi:arginine exporter protein ArgO
MEILYRKLCCVVDLYCNVFLIVFCYTLSDMYINNSHSISVFQRNSGYLFTCILGPVQIRRALHSPFCYANAT